jgi:hypothetical protein
MAPSASFLPRLSHARLLPFATIRSYRILLALLCLFGMPRKGSSFNRTPHPIRSRSDGLSLHVQRQLLLDLENPELKTKGPATIIAGRTELYSKDDDNGKYQRAVKDKILHLRKLKESHPPDYWYVSWISSSFVHRFAADADSPDPVGSFTPLL